MNEYQPDQTPEIPGLPEPEGEKQMNTELATQGGFQPMNAADIQQRVNMVQQIYRGIMKKGQHYDTIPGCGDKPALLKSGAEIMSLAFRLRPIMDNDQDIRIIELDDGHREVRVYCHILNNQGVELATGVGSCSTMESKYRYRGGQRTSTGQPVPKEYWNLKKTNPAAALEKIGGDGFGVMKEDGAWVICEKGEKEENPDIADTYNTVLKMAKKRAYVDGILSATAASDIFTQDIEEMSGFGNKPEAAQKPAAATKPPVQPPTAKQPPPAQKQPTPQGPPPEDHPPVEPPADGPVISQAQGKRLYAIAMNAGMDKTFLKQWLEENYGYTSTTEVKVADYEKICERAEQFNEQWK